MNRGKRDVRPGPWQKEPYGPLPDTTIVPKRRGGRKKRMARPNDVPAPDFDDSVDDEVRITHSAFTGNYISFYNVDPNKVIVTLVY